MKQLSVALVIVAVLVAFVQAGGPQTEEMKAIVQKCIAKEGATPADVEAIEKHARDLTKQAKCTIACTLTEAGLLSPDGKLLKDGFMKQAVFMSKGDANMLKQNGEIFDKCQGMGDADICEAAFKYCGCIDTEMKARGLSEN